MERVDRRCFTQACHRIVIRGEEYCVSAHPRTLFSFLPECVVNGDAALFDIRYYKRAEDEKEGHCDGEKDDVHHKNISEGAFLFFHDLIIALRREKSNDGQAGSF